MRPTRAGESTLGTSSVEWFVFACDKCGRRGEYRRETLIGQFGPATYVVGLPERVAIWRGCELAIIRETHHDLQKPQPCGIRYDIDLAG
jgi:hypothetical protein